MFFTLSMNSLFTLKKMPHQIEAVYGYVLKLPRIRFLIADDPGAGFEIASLIGKIEVPINSQIHTGVRKLYR